MGLHCHVFFCGKSELLHICYVRIEFQGVCYTILSIFRLFRFFQIISTRPFAKGKDTEGKPSTPPEGGTSARDQRPRGVGGGAGSQAWCFWRYLLATALQCQVARPLGLLG